MEVNSLTGGATAISAFDINGDNMFDDKDKISNSNIAGVKSTAGMLKNPVWLESFKGGAVKELSGSSGNIMTLKNRSLIIPGTVKRLSWQQLQ